MTASDGYITSDLLLPEAKAFYKTLQGGKRWADMTPEELREGWLADLKPFQKPAGVAKVYDLEAAGRNGQIPLCVYQPGGSGPFPLMLWYHPGGFVGGGGKDAFAGQPASMCQHCRAVVVSVDYRLAPEFPFPAAVEDSYDALVWVAARAEQLSGDATRIACCGASAGGALATLMTLIARDEGGPRVRAQVMISALTTAAEDTPSYTEFAHDQYMSNEDMYWFRDHYLPPGTDRRHLWASPLLAPDLSRLPPCFCLTAEVDVLRDEAEEYARKLEAAGVEVKLKRYKGHFHISMINGDLFPESAPQCFQEISDFLHMAWQQA